MSFQEFNYVVMIKQHLFESKISINNLNFSILNYNWQKINKMNSCVILFVNFCLFDRNKSIAYIILNWKHYTSLKNLLDHFIVICVSQLKYIVSCQKKVWVLAYYNLKLKILCELCYFPCIMNKLSSWF